MKHLSFLLLTALLYSGMTAQTPLTKKEEKFVRHVSEVSMLEVKSGELAQSQAQSAEVKAAGKRLAEDYRATGQKIADLASRKQVTLATELSTGEQKFYNWLAKKQGRDFDKAYLRCTSKANRKGICKVKKIYKRSDDTELKNWAGQMLSTLEMHRTLLKQTCKTLKDRKS